jgi:hypothetical protein
LNSQKVDFVEKARAGLGNCDDETAGKERAVREGELGSLDWSECPSSVWDVCLLK